MISRTMSACAIVAIISVGSVYGTNVVVDQINANKFTLGAVAFNGALSEDADAAKAALETMGAVLDSGNKAHYLLVPVNFGTNWAARKALRGMGANKIKLSGFGSNSNDVGEIASKALIAAAPQLAAGLVMMAINGSMSSAK